MRFPSLPKFNFRIPNPFRRRQAAGGEAGASTSSFNMLRPTRDKQGAESPAGWHTQDARVLRVANPDRNVSPERPGLTRIDTDVANVPSIEVQSATPGNTPLSANPSLNRHHPNGSADSFEYNPQWVGHAGDQPMMPIVDTPNYGTLHVVNGSPSTSGSSSPESVRSKSPEAQHMPNVPAWEDGFDPRQFPPPGGFRRLERSPAHRLNEDKATEQRQLAAGKSIERPDAPRPDDIRNAGSRPIPAAPHGSVLNQPNVTPPIGVNFSRPFGPNNPFPGHVYGTDA